mmetsp:Transcript_17959/g.22628  ORF Transcript_17959/g.22628 Transcript_17959/m.22628 type:complete len:152 (-) Transcript_17959:7-462(-)
MSTAIIIGVILVSLIFISLICCCAYQADQRERKDAIQLILGYYEDGLESARKYVEESKARKIAATAATPTEVTEASPVAVPTSGSYIATKKRSRYSPSDERFASTDSQHKSQMFKAEFNLVFTPDEEYGYTIKGKGIDKYVYCILCKQMGR